MESTALGRVGNKMAEALTSEGYSLTGHGELPPQVVGTIQAKIFPDSVIYQRPQTMSVSLKWVVCRNMKIGANQVVGSKLVFHLNARSFSPFGEYGLCSCCG